MTLLATTTRQSFACDGVSQDFPIGIVYYDKADLQVWLKDDASGAETQLAGDSDYRIEGEIGGSARLHSLSAYPAGKTLTLLRRTALQQSVDYAENDAFPAATHERALDRAVARDQELSERLDRALGIGPSDSGNLTLPPAKVRAGKALVFDPAGHVGVSQDDYADQAAAAALAAAAAAANGSACATAQVAAEAARDLALTYGAALSGASATPLAVGTGNRLFATQSGKAWIAGQRLRAASGDGSKVMDGEVLTYSGSSLTLSVDYVEGSGSHADWGLSLVGPRGPAGVGATADNVSVVPAGGIASTNVQSALAELDGEKLAKAGGVMTGQLGVTIAGTAPVPQVLTAIDESANGGISYRIKQTATPAASDIIWDDASFSYDSGGALQLYTRQRSYLVDPTAGSEDGGYQWFAAQAGVETQQASLAGGVFSAASDLRIGGVSINPIGRQTVFIPAGAMTPRQSGGAALNTTESATNKINCQSLDFDPSLTEYAQFQLAMPRSWNEGALAARFIWLSGGGTGDVVWAIQAAALSDDDPLDAGFGAAASPSAASGVDGVTAAADVMISAETTAFTAGGSPSTGDLLVFQVYRDAAAGADSLAADARLLGIVLHYVTDAATDA